MATETTDKPAIPMVDPENRADYAEEGTCGDRLLVKDSDFELCCDQPLGHADEKGLEECPHTAWDDGIRADFLPGGDPEQPVHTTFTYLVIWPAPPRIS